MIKKKVKKKFKIIEPVKETQIIDYIPEKKECSNNNSNSTNNNEDENLDEIDYFSDEPLSEDEDESNIKLLEDKLFNDYFEKENDEDISLDNAVESIDISDKIHNSHGNNQLQSESYNY
jgi:hypothetical protein